MILISKKKIATALIAGLLLLPGMALGASAPVTMTRVNGELLSAMPKPAPESKRIILPSAIQASELYGFGLQHRNASIQYSIFSKEFKKIMYPRFVELNWVTGVSSPWITNYEVTKETIINKNSEVIEMRLDTATSSGPAPSIFLTISLVQEKNSWVITGVTSDPELPRGGLPRK
ncbi:hypothetical protein NYE27_11090 [Paenibacillus sp. FSL R10-2779]|uniref:hypothetical protein n=1 Tax=Paenibacillus TaxID=44249 RepID=UPI00056EF439|nr:hypothetical protein [Paenibacillus odorifer]OMD29310.1 hypothetical protein BJP48_17825 [Paenibacillus odorifer]